MADTFKSLADLTTINDARLADRDISDLLDQAPVLARLAADTSPDTVHRYTKETGAPTVGFRAVNDGRDNEVSTDTALTETLEILDASFAVDQALADAYKHGPEAYVGRESERHLRAAFFKAELQLLNGTVAGHGGDSAGFTGIGDELNVLGDAMVSNGDGTLGGSIYTSVYAIYTSLDDIAIIMGNSGNISMGETVTQRIAGSVTGTFPGLYTPITGWMALQRGGLRSAGRLCNLDDISDKLTDAKLSLLLKLFASGKWPTFFAMNNQSVQQLQASRTATNATGAPAPWPVDAFGIPIIQTDGITITQPEIVA